jgi:putative transposase
VFFTVALAERGSDLLFREAGRLRDAVRVTRAERPFRVEAWVVLPDHLHAVWTLPDGDRDFGIRWGAIKARFTMALRRAEAEAIGRPGFNPAAPLPTEFPVVRSGQYAGLKPGLRVGKREQAIWQRRFWEHHIRDDADFANHVRYCWGNPVKHGNVERAVDWPYSSIHRDIRLGRVEAEWSGEVPESDGQYGE